MLRWSEDWAKSTVEHFGQKWRLATTRHFGDEDSSLELEDTAVRWVRAHRRLATGLRVPGGWDDHVESAIEQARLMIALFQSVDRDSFDLALTTADDEQVETSTAVTPEMALDRLPIMIDRAEKDCLNILIRPRAPRRPHEPALVRVDLDPEGLKRVEPYGFLSLETGNGRYQVWLAVDRSNWRSASILRRLAATFAESDGRTAFSRLAGSRVLKVELVQNHGAGDRAKLHGGVAGTIATGMDLEAGGVLAELWSGQMF